MIAKDFHLAKDSRQIRGKSFVIMGAASIDAGYSGQKGCGQKPEPDQLRVDRDEDGE
jgi:hypothetical protein